MNNWLFLRGEWDERTQKSIDDNDDMWLQLFDSLVSVENSGDVWFKDKQERLFRYNNTQICSTEQFNPVYLKSVDYVFARGGFDYYKPTLDMCVNAYKIRYGAGCRYMPEQDINYDLILVDTEEQKRNVINRCRLNKHYERVELFIKPAASHFKPVECEKEYDVCYIANQQQAKIKGVKWVYETVPRNLKVLHLGYIDKHITPPSNVTRKRVDRIDMPEWISKCKIGIVPYSSVDSSPRALVEMIACGLPVVCLDTVNYWKEKYDKYFKEFSPWYNDCKFSKDKFWESVEVTVDYVYSELVPKTKFIGQGFSTDEIDPKWTPPHTRFYNFYKESLSLPVAAQYLKDLINDR